MKRLFLLLLAGMAVSACSPGEPVSQSTSSPASPTPLPSLPPPPTPLASPSPASPVSQTYRDPKGQFEISFPRGYTHKGTGTGVAFVSADQGFAGAVDYGSAEGRQLTSEQLETALKTEYQTRLQEVTWQATKVQPDGSVRIDWVGKDDNNNMLDAVSIVEQRGNTIYVLNLLGVNQPYQNYNQDAEAIVNSYRIQPGSPASPAPNASPASPQSPAPQNSPSSQN